MSKKTTSLWKQIDFPALRSIELTTDTHEFSRDKWPYWAVSSTNFTRLTIHDESRLHSASPPSGVVATLMSERIDLKDAPYIYNYDICMIVETADGRFYQLPPIKTDVPKHHSTSPSTWFDALGAPL
jgi:hypothetical protein